MTSYALHFFACKLLTGLNNPIGEPGRLARTSFHSVYLPFIWIAMMLTVIGRKLISGFVHGVIKSTGFWWSSIEAYLDSK